MNLVREECEDFLCSHQAYQERIGSTITSYCEHSQDCLHCDHAIYQNKSILALFPNGCELGYPIGWTL